MNIDPLTPPPVCHGRSHQVMSEKMIEMPPRSRLYCLAPLGMGTVEVESLTSYIQRLAWAYRVSSWVLVVQEVLPLYDGPYDLRSSPQRLGDSAGHEPCASMERERLRAHGSRRLSNSLEDLTFMFSQPIPGPADYQTGDSCELLRCGALPVISNGRSRDSLSLNRLCGRCRL